MTETTVFRIGDTVSGTYHGVPFVGVIAAFDSFGVSFDVSGFTYLGTPRDGVYLRDMRGCTLVSRPETVSVGTAAGFTYLKS